MLSHPARYAHFFIGTLILAALSRSHAQESIAFTASAGEHTQVFQAALPLRRACSASPVEADSLCLQWHFSVGLWRVRERHDGTRRKLLADFGITPSVRWSPVRGPLYVEAGLGVHWLAPRFANQERELSTNLQFGTHLGLGLHLDRGAEVFTGIQHYSNAGLRQPNDGMNFFQVRFSRAF